MCNMLKFIKTYNYVAKIRKITLLRILVHIPLFLKIKGHYIPVSFDVELFQKKFTGCSTSVPGVKRYNFYSVIEENAKG